MQQTKRIPERHKTVRQSGRHDAITMVQVLLGVGLFFAYLMIDGMASDVSWMNSMQIAAPFLLAYLSGVFARFIPGMKWISRRIG